MGKPMRMRRSRLAAGLLCTAAWLAGCTAGPSAAGPDYAGALADLDAARALLREPATATVIEPQVYAAAQADVAAGLVRARYGRHPPAVTVAAPDPAWTRVDRVHYALQHLDAARVRLTREEYDVRRHALRNEAISSIARAQEALGRALEALLR